MLKHLLLRNHSGVLILFIHVYDIIHYINCVFLFCSGKNWLLWHFFFFFWLHPANIQVSVCRTIGPLVSIFDENLFRMMMGLFPIWFYMQNFGSNIYDILCTLCMSAKGFQTDEN